MVEKVEFWLNVVHYCLFLAANRLHIFSNKVNPFILLGRIPAIKRRLDEQKTSLTEITNKIWLDERFGYNIMISGGALAILVFILIWTSFLFFNYLLSFPIPFSWVPFASCLLVAYAICQVLVFRRDKYLWYFKRFREWGKADKRKYAFVAILFTISCCILFVASFRFLDPNG